MGNGALPNGLSYRAHPRLYRLRHAAMFAVRSLSGEKRTFRGRRVSEANYPSPARNRSKTATTLRRSSRNRSILMVASRFAWD